MGREGKEEEGKGEPPRIEASGKSEGTREGARWRRRGSTLKEERAVSRISTLLCAPHLCDRHERFRTHVDCPCLAPQMKGMGCWRPAPTSTLRKISHHDTYLGARLGLDHCLEEDGHELLPLQHRQLDSCDVGNHLRRSQQHLPLRRCPHHLTAPSAPG